MKDIFNIEQHDIDYPVQITFEVQCNSHTSMMDGETLKERILDYIKECTDAMDDSMRHWGDHYHDINPIKIEIFDENDKVFDETNKVLEKKI